MSIQEAYGEWSASYDTDRNLTRDLDGLVTRQVLGDLRPTAVLELGSGTGKNTPFYAQISQWVLALDFSAGMVGKARAKLGSEPVLFGLADLTQPWPAAAHAFDLAAFNLVLEHIADLDAVCREARRVLRAGGHLYISELHPFRQYQGKKAVFQRGGAEAEIPAYVHHISDFLRAAESAGLTLEHLGEWWHEADAGTPPRLVTFRFRA